MKPTPLGFLTYTLVCILVIQGVYATCASFNTTGYGAAKPVLSATANENSVTLTLTMYRQTTDNAGVPRVFHDIDTKSPSYQCHNVDDNIVPSIGKAWKRSTNACESTYTITQSLAELQSPSTNNNWKRSISEDGRTVSFSVPVYATYSVNTEDGCYYVGYHSTVNTRAVLSINGAASEFTTSDDSAQFTFGGLRITSNNELEMIGSMKPLLENSQIQAITMTKVSGNVNIPPSQSSCTNAAGCPMVFKTATSALGGAGADISGQYTCTMDVYENGVKTRPSVSFTFTLSYIIPADPSVLDSDTIAIEQKQYTNANYNVVRTSRYKTDTQFLYIENALTAASPVTPARYRLRMTEGYICCVQYLTTITPYNPVSGTGGCKDPTDKAEWASLGSEFQAPVSGVVITSADAVKTRRYRVQIELNQMLTRSEYPRPMMSCETLFVSKMVDISAGRIENGVPSATTFISTVPFTTEEAKKEVSGSSGVVGIYATMLIMVFVCMIL